MPFSLFKKQVVPSKGATESPREVPHDEELREVRDIERMEEELRNIVLQQNLQMQEFLAATRKEEEERVREEERRAKEHARQMEELLEQSRRASEQRRLEEEERRRIDRETREREREERRKREENENIAREMIRLEERNRWKEKEQAANQEMKAERERYTEASNAILEERDAELLRIAQESLRNREESEEKLRGERERIARTQDELKTRFRAQIADLYMQMRASLWTKHIEAQWASRLSELRTSGTPALRLFNEIRCDIEICIEQASFSDYSRSQIETKLALLKDELAALIDIMLHEVDEMQKFAVERPGTKFLVDIEKSAKAVAEAASVLVTAIEQMEKGLKSDANQELSLNELSDCQKSCDELKKRVDSIPTVMELKEKYAHANPTVNELKD